MSRVTCHMSCVKCHMLCVMRQGSHVMSKLKKKFDKIVEIGGGGFVINGATASSFVKDELLTH